MPIALIAAAREHGCDESEAAFLVTMKKLAAAKPTTNEQLKEKRRKPKNG